MIDPIYFSDWEEMKELRNIIKNSIGNIEFARKCNEEIRKKLTESDEVEEEDFLEEQFIREIPFELFEGQIRSMKLISNHICFGPPPEPEDEVEQHLSLLVDGRVFFSGYVFGERTDFKYETTQQAV